jgi:acyl-CoA thioesterase I
MKTRRRLTIATLICLLAGQVAACRSAKEGSSSEPAASAAAPAPHVPGGERGKIVMLGDSLTAGLGLLDRQSYPALIQQKLNAEGYDYDVENAGVSGDTSAGGLRRLNWALQGNVRVLVVALGANDGLRGLSTAEMKKNLAQIIDGAQARHITVVLAGMEAPPNYGQEYAAAFRQVFSDLAKDKRVPLVPFLLDRVAGLAEFNQGDGVHPNAQGAEIVANTVWRTLRPVLDQIAAS